ncbi:MAG: GNAT family N-acetyltransferase, partial [Anaerolineae bacterium]|nr:GNAT family N-acetyltransferase [Anaerolineae bacterium]
DHTWITRLGVVPGKRQYGAGSKMMQYLIDQSRSSGAAHIILEVIVNNKPAHRLFTKCGFIETRELLILRRPPGAPQYSDNGYHARLIDDPVEVYQLLETRRSTPSWLDDYPSLVNAGYMHAIIVRSDTGDWGWLVYQKTVFQLGRIVIQTERGDPIEVGAALIHALHTYNPNHDTKTENLPRQDPHLPTFFDARYIESFARIEMRLDFPDSL